MNKNIIILLGGLYFAVIAGLYFFVDNPAQDIYASFFVNTIGISAVIAGFLTASKYGFDHYHGRSFLLLAAGIFFWLLGDILWYITRAILGEAPFPSIIDAVYLVGYPILYIGLWRELFSEKIKIDFKNFVLPILLSALMAVAIAYFSIYKPFNSGDSCTANIINMAYGLGDFGLAIVCLFIIIKTEHYHKGKFYYPWLAIFIGFSTFLGADILHSIYWKEFQLGKFWYFDLVWTFSYLMLAYGYWRMGDIIDGVNQSILKKIIK